MASEVRQKQVEKSRGSSQVIRLGPGECPDPETGARFFAALAFPGAREEQARIEAVQGWTGAYLHEANKVDVSDAPFEDPRLNAFVERPLQWCKAKVRTGRRRLRDRSDAARVARPWVREILDSPHPPVLGIRKFTQRQIALHLFDGDAEKAAIFSTVFGVQAARSFTLQLHMISCCRPLVKKKRSSDSISPRLNLWAHWWSERNRLNL